MIETDKIRGWERLTAAIMREAATDDPEAFAQVVRMIDDARSQLHWVAETLRTPGLHSGTGAPGYSWAELANALGVTRSAAYQRFRVIDGG
jgi:hypothetical protein